MNSVESHTEIRKALLKSIQNNNLSPALLFYGPRGIGKKRTAFEILRTLICSSFPSCKNCRVCRQIENKQHPSLLFIEPEGLNIKIEVISKIRSFISLQSFSSCRAVVIDQAHTMNHQTQNALLKSLEEPPQGAHFILICSQMAKLLPTIRSRTQLIRFNRLSFQEMAKILPEEKDWILKASRGQLNRVNQWKDEAKLYQDIFNLLEDQKIPSALSVRLRERKTALLTAQTLQEILRDIRVLQAGGRDLIHVHQASRCKKWLKISPTAVYQLYHKACQLEQDILSYLDSLLCFENYWNQARRYFSEKNHHVG